MMMIKKTNFNPVLIRFMFTSGVKGQTKMAPSKKKHASSQPCIIPGGFTGIVRQIKEYLIHLFSSIQIYNRTEVVLVV